MSGGDLAAFVFYAVMMASAVATISEVMGELQRAAGATERLIELLNVESLIPTGVGERYCSASRTCRGIFAVLFIMCNLPTHLDLQFPALNNFSLEVARGKSLALVGPSGAGKSTVFELIQRFYDPAAGEITLDGVDIRSLTTDSLRTQLAVVAQQPVLFTADVAYNIRYGKPTATDEEVKTRS